METKQVILKQPIALLDSLLNISSDIAVIKHDLKCSETFTRDTLEDFFYKYEETSDNKDPDTSRVILHDIQHYRVYLLSIIDYIMQINDKFAYIDEHLNNALGILKDGECYEWTSNI